jgi:hypothetical protein
MKPTAAMLAVVKVRKMNVQQNEGAAKMKAQQK